MVLEKTLASPLDYKEIQPVHPKGDQSWVFIGSTDVEVETPILWPPDVKSWCTWKDPDAGKYWGQEEKGTTEVEMVGWHHQLKGHEFEWTLGVGDGQGGLACCGSWGHKELDTTEQLNWTVKGFGIINKAEVYAFPEFSCIFYDTTDIGNLISGSSAFSKSSLYILKFIHILSGLSFPSPGDLPHPGIQPASPALQADTLQSEPPGKLNYPLEA